MRIRVTVFKQRGRPHLVAEWRDPLTGKLKRKSTGEKVRREAERFAARLEKELNEGRRSDYRTTWQDFRTRYENEVLPFKKPSTASSAGRAFDIVEEIVDPKFVVSVTAGEISRISAALVKRDLSEATIASNLRMLKAALRWAARLKLIPEAPQIVMPTKAGEKAGGRAVTVEEFERMLAAVPKAIQKNGEKLKPAAVESWRFLLRGLWWSGLRLMEACRLHWTDDRYITVRMKARTPLFEIQSEANKNRKDQKFPMAREFFEMLSEVTDDERDGFVFNPWLRAHRGSSTTGYRSDYDRISKVVSKIGREASVVVDRESDGSPVYATAHDLRRSFGTRWAKRVLPPVLKALMRHTSIQTTMTFYVDQSAEDAADLAWKAAEPSKDAGSPIISPITDFSSHRSV